MARLRARSIVWALALVACGSGEITAGGSESETGGDGETGDDPGGLACFDENGLVPGALRLLATEPTRAWLIEGGAEIDLPLQGEGEPTWFRNNVAGDYIAVARVDGPLEDLDSIVHAFSRSTGELLWSREIPEFAVGALWVSDDGEIAGATVTPLEGELLGFVTSDADMILLPNHEPMAAPALGHVIAIERNTLTLGWLELATNTWIPATPQPSSIDDAFYDNTQDGHTLEYVTFVDGAGAFVVARPNEAETFALPFEELPQHDLSIVARNGPYLIVRHDTWDNTDVSAHARVDVESGEVVLIDPEPPPGWSFFDCYERKITVDDDGYLYFVLRSDASLRLWAHDIEQDEWMPVGLDLVAVDDVEIEVVSQDVVHVTARDFEQSYCSTDEWAEPPEGGLIGDSMHLVRREPALAMVVSPTWNASALIDRQQRCVAGFGDNGWEVRPLGDIDAVFEVGWGHLMWLD
jgi:hypothetical protein